MLFSNAIRSRVVSLLQPWLREGADVELELGLLHSYLSVKDLVFDVEAINQLIEGSQVLCFKHVKVRSLNIRMSPWSVPAFAAEVSGVDVALGVREPRHQRPLPRPGDVDGTNDRKMKELLALIDPEGCQLHGAIEKLLAAPPRSRSISMTNVILRLCQLQFHQVNLQIQWPESVTTLSCFLKLKTLSAGCSLVDPRCLLRGFIETIFVPLEESFLVVKGTDFEFGWEKENNVNLIASCKDLVASVKLRNLQLTECDVKAPQVDFTVPLSELSALTHAINILSHRQVMRGRSGRELWMVARRKISYLTHGQWSSWCYLLRLVFLWVRYIQVYESLLLFVGYCTKGKFGLSQDGRSSSTCKHQLSMVYELEKELPVEAVARARRISRYKAALHQSESAKHSQITGCWRILLLFLFLWKGVCYIVHLIKKILLLLMRQIQIWCCKADQPTDFSVLNFKGCPSKSTFRLNLNAISINFNLTNSHKYPVSRKLAPDVRFPHLDSVSFCFVLKALCLSYVEDFTSQTFSVACGDVKICCSSLSKGPILRNRSAVEMGQLFKGLGSGFDGYSKTFFWTEPAPHFDIPENDIDVAAFTNDACAILLKYYLGEMWLGWRNNAMNFDGNETHYLEHPFLLCEMRTFIVDPYIHVPEHGLSVCYLTLGRLNVDLDYMSLVSVLRLLSQILDTCRCNLNNKLKKGLSDTSVTNEEAAEWDGTDGHLVRRTKMALLRLIPERNIHVGLAIAGSTIRVSPLGGWPGRKEISFNHVTAQQLGNYSFQVEVSKIEAAIWPASKSILGALTGNKMLAKVASEYLLVGEPPVIDMPKVDLHETFSSKGIIALDANVRIDGINVSCEDMEERQAFQVIGLISATFKASTKREYFHSFQSMNTLSVTLIGNIERATFLLYMDELLAFFMELERVLLNVGDGNYEHDSDGEDLVDELAYNDMTKPAKEACILPLWILRNTKFAVNATLDLRSMDIIMVKSLKVCTMANSRIDGASVGTSEKFIISDDKFECSTHELPNYGVGYLQKPLYVMISYQDKALAAFVNMLGLDVVIFRNQNATAKCSHVSELGDLLHCPVNCLSEFCVSNLSFSISAALFGNALPPGANYASFSNDGLEIKSEGCSQKLRQGQSALDTSEPPDGQWIQINLELSETSLAGPSIKRDLMGAQQLNKLLLSLSIGRQFHKVHCDIQGGSVILEATALCTLVQCFIAYLQGVINLCSLTSFEQPTTSVETHAIRNVTLTNKQKFPEFLNLKISNLDLVIAKADGSGGLSGLSLQSDFLLNLESMNSKSKFICDLSRVTICSQFLSLRNCSDQVARDYRTPHFSSISNDSTSSQVSENVVADANEVSTTNNVDLQRYILKHGLFVIMAEKMEPGSEVGCFFSDNDWSGGGSLSGFDISITLSEIQMVLDLIAALSEVSSYKTSQDLKLEQKQRSTDQPQDGDARNIIPDGAVVAIKDLQQHMYFAVEAVESKYHLVGVVHYSLVGERALFQVRYHNQRRWRSRALWFSLVSLYAKNDKGEPLRLNFSPGSAFVDISSTDDKAWACWLASSFRPTGYMGDENAVFDYRSSTRLFSLVNQKSNYAVAFVDGVPEFVRKPGNPFKMKVFDEFPLSEVVRKYVPKNGTGETFKTDLSANRSEKAEVSMFSRNFPYMVITFDKVTLTVYDEVSVNDEAFPLLQGCISNFESKLQVSSSKVTYISTFTAALYYFDARRGFWREIVSPVEACVFYRHKFVLQYSDDVRSRQSASFFFTMKQVDISLPELSLDILLFIVGKLDLAGPYAVKSSNIFANGCKVENRLGITVLCSVNDKKDFIVAGRHSASVFLRHALLPSQPQEKTSLLSFQISEQGSFSTSPIQVSLINAQVFAWRTRVISLKDSRTFPGPVVVVDISGKEEEGVSVVVSPMVRIHNQSGFPMEVRLCRPQEARAESASALLENGDTIDDSMAVFDALGLSGGSKKAIMSLSLGNFLLSFRPELPECSAESEGPVSVDWSEDLKGGKAIHVSGIFDKLNFRLKRAFGMAKVKSSFSTTHCSISIEGHTVSKLHFLIQTLSRDVPLKHPRILEDSSDKTLKPAALHEQKEIFLLPTVQITNLLQTDILVVLTETHPGSFSDSAKGLDLIGKKAEITCGSSAYLYANPTLIYFTVTLKELNSSCRPVHSGDCVKKLNKQKSDVRHLDVELEFSGGKYSAFLRLSRGDKGILEAVVYTSYMLHNQTDLPLLCFASKQKLLSWSEVEKYGSNIPPEFGSLLPSNSVKSWFHKSSRVYLKWMEEKASQTFVDLDILSGFTELGLEMQRGAGVMQIAKLGVSVKSYSPGIVVPSQIVSMVPRYIIFNETADDILFRQSCFEGDADAATTIRSHLGVALQMRLHADKRREISFLDSVLKKHRIIGEESLIFVHFGLKESGWSWSGPVCVTSLGRFYIKFKKQPASVGGQSNVETASEDKLVRYAAVHTAEEGSSIVLRFNMPPNMILPYRIENSLSEMSVVYYQKDSMNTEILRPGTSTEYVWDDLCLPHKLVVQLSDTHLSREINIDKMCPWKPFFKLRHTKGLAVSLPFEKKSRAKRRSDEAREVEMLKVWYQVYADGLTRVLQICGSPDNDMEVSEVQLTTKVQIRVPSLSIHLLEEAKLDVEGPEEMVYSPLIAARFGNVNLDSIFTGRNKFNQIKVQSLIVDEKWQGAPFAALIRRHQLDYDDMNEHILRIVFNLDPTKSKVKQVTYASIVLQPINLNVDEESLMRLVAFWRTSLADSSGPSTQFYFKHFEIHPIKIVATFLPGNPNSSYSSAQETLRTLLHSVIKIPTVKNKVVELNGVLLTHALVTARELLIKCAQHYSWYSMRAIYILKGSTLLPPAFASIFDDTASSSLDVFFDPSSGLVSLPGLTLGMFKFISKCIDTKGFSGTKRYFGDLGKTMRTAGSNVLFAAITEISDSVLRGAETSGLNGMVHGFHQGILKLAMEPSLLGTAVMEGGPDRKINLDHSPGADELYIEGYLQAMLDTIYKQDYLRVRVIDDQVILKNLPPNSSVIDEIMEHVKSFLVSKNLLKGEANTNAIRPLRHLRGETEWKIGPTLITLCEHLFVSFTIRFLRKQAGALVARIEWKKNGKDEGTTDDMVPASSARWKFSKNWGISKFILSGVVAYLDGRLCRHIPNALARRIVSGFLLSFLEKDDSE
ncbi:hypothetical protein H6P81_020976 [Aristolochia fimbriata]|uniref:Vacuolar protein sorting-associated protein 13 VPS13 adaptor binding domain-containing protein n=1 Tax=Aristolochia fimbriata TaxID=158543 RepID=A0AAV7DX51_ARIFI|nr:hypothetical protein H6P81_020976 [Aristolochia fimbriata]